MANRPSQRIHKKRYAAPTSPNPCQITNLHAKTGWVAHAAQNATSDGIAWYVGWVEHAGRRWFFAMNMDVINDGDVAKRIPLTKQLLKEISALPASAN